MLHREWKTTVARTALLSVVAFAVQAQARDYYVESSNSTASDGNPGTREKPFKTLSHAGNTARPGDHVFIRGGLYRETLTIKSPNDYPAKDKTGFGKVLGRHNQRSTGWNTDRIVFEAYENEAVTIAGSDILPPALFEPVAGKKGLYAVSLKEALKDKLSAAGVRFSTFVPPHVFWNGHSIPAHRVRDEQGVWKPAIPGADDAQAWGARRTWMADPQSPAKAIGAHPGHLWLDGCRTRWCLHPTAWADLQPRLPATNNGSPRYRRRRHRDHRQVRMTDDRSSIVWHLTSVSEPASDLISVSEPASDLISVSEPASDLRAQQAYSSQPRPPWIDVTTSISV